MSKVAERLKQRLPKKGFIRSVGLLAGGTALGQGMVMLSSPVLTRLYAPAEIGALAIFMSAVSILTMVTSLRYEMTIPLAEDDEGAANLLVLSLLLTLLLSVLMGSSVWLLRDAIVHWARAPALRPYLWLLPLSLWGSGTYRALNQWALRKQDFTPVAYTQISQGVSQALAQVGLGLLKVGVVGLLVGDALGRTSGSSTLASLAWRRDRAALRFVSWARMRRAARLYRQFPLLSSPAVLLNSIGLQLPTLLLAAFYGPTITGWFALGQRVIMVPSILVGRAVAQVYYAEASRLAREDPAGLRSLFLKTAQGLFLIGIVPIVLLAMKGPWLFALAFGNSWQQSGLYVGILVPMVVLQFTSFPLGASLDAVNRQDLQLAREFLRVASMSGAVIWAGTSHLPPVTTISIISVVGSAGYLLHILVSWRAITGFVRFRGKDECRIVPKNCLDYRNRPAEAGTTTTD